MPAELHRIAVRKKVDQLDRAIREQYMFNLETYYIPVIQDIILQSYDIELTGRVTNRRAKTNPIYYRDEFQEALYNFEWITEARTQTILMTPETDTFNWNQGRLRIIENIVEGTIGRLAEIDEEQYIAMYDKRPIVQPFDRAVPLKQRIYLLRLTGDLRRRWRQAYPRDAMVIFPFSNTPPIDIFFTANQYVEENIRGWIDEAIRESQKEIAR